MSMKSAHFHQESTILTHKKAVNCDGKYVDTVYIIVWVKQCFNNFALIHSLSYILLTVKGPRYATNPADRNTSPATLLTM